MAEVSYLLRPHDDDDDDDERDDVVVTLPYWSHDFDAFEVFAFDPDFPPSDLSLSLGPARRRDPDRIDEVSEPDSIATIKLFNRENQVNFVMDLFHQRVEQSSMGDSVSLDPDLGPIFGVIEGNDEMGSTSLELDLGLGFCTERHGLAVDDGDDHNCGFLGGNCDDEFFVSRRGSVSESGESSTAQFSGDLSVVGVVSESEEDENEIVGVDLNVEDDCGLDNACDDLQLCWDSFQLEDHGDRDEDFEWEEVDDGVDEREVLSMFFDADVDEDLDVSVATVIPAPEEIGVERVDTMRNLEWEVLLNVHNLDTNVNFGHDGEGYLGDYDEYNYTAEYEMLFGQFAENENALIGRPPASKTVLENLPSVILTQEDVENDNALCAVCKDGIIVGEQAKQLPCSHRYHGDCIVPWLGIRNTCPVCRYELPTDDPDYERRRTQRAGGRSH
ncbi:E3 ubiquitin-protein like [Actinidia chinensis var. chinensis]|uniref:RING-type E3 ubiquitin transferase n=1 Tax=Actinidia chinensis var. chinensis TaxID=1590841 RepID=A0A2R6PUE3_ACTCC|nr:E3 ubiquitin-protein like [Actinidia chinensis var. chinensis]